MINLECFERKLLAGAIKNSEMSTTEIARKAGLQAVTITRHLEGPPETMNADNLKAIWEVLIDLYNQNNPPEPAESVLPE